MLNLLRVLRDPDVFVEKNVPRAKIGVHRTTAMFLGDSFGQLSPPYYPLVQDPSEKKDKNSISCIMYKVTQTRTDIYPSFVGGFCDSVEVLQLYYGIFSSQGCWVVKVNVGKKVFCS